MIPRDQEGKVRQPGGLSDRGEPYQGVPRRTKSCTAFPPNKNRASESKRCSLSRWRGFFLRKWALQGCALQGNPLIGFPHEKTSHRDVFSPLPDLLGSSRCFALCGGRGRGFAPSIPTSLLKKAGPKTLFVLTGRFYESHGPLKSSPRSLSRGYQSLARRSWPRRHG